MLKAKASATRSKMTRHGLAQAGSRAKLSDLLNYLKKIAFIELLMGHQVVFGTAGRSAYCLFLLPTCILPLLAYGTAVQPLPNPLFHDKRRKKILVSD